MTTDLDKFYDTETKILKDSSELDLETIYLTLKQFVKNNYNFIVENTDEWYDISYDIDVLEQIPSLKTLSLQDQQKYIQTLFRYDNSKEILIARYAWMIGLTRIVLYHPAVLQYEKERMDNLASIFDDSTPEDLQKAGRLITDLGLYEMILFKKEPYMEDTSVLKMAKEEMIGIYDSEHKPTIIH